MTASESVDLTALDDDTEEDEPVITGSSSAIASAAASAAAAASSSTFTSLQPAPKRQRSGDAIPVERLDTRAWPGAWPVERLDLPGGVLDDSLLARVAAICQQENCVGCDGRGLAAGVSEKLPYGCSYADRRRMPPANKFAVPEDRAKPGTIDVRRPPGGDGVIVVNLFAQWEMGAPGKYNRVAPCPPSDSASTRASWFKQCLAAIGALDPPLPSLAFPHEIGCGLAGGDWRRYEAMILEFAQEHPTTKVTIARWTGGGAGRGVGRGGGRGGGGGGRGSCFKCGQPGHWANACPRR